MSAYIIPRGGPLEPACRLYNEGDHVLVAASRRVMIPGKVKSINEDVVIVQTDDGNLVSVHNSTVYSMPKHDGS